MVTTNKEEFPTSGNCATEKKLQFTTESDGHFVRKTLTIDGLTHPDIDIEPILQDPSSPEVEDQELGDLIQGCFGDRGLSEADITLAGGFRIFTPKI